MLLRGYVFLLGRYCGTYCAYVLVATMIALALTLLAGSPIAPSLVAGREYGVPVGVLLRICRRESRCLERHVDSRDAWASARSRRKAIRVGWLSEDCGNADEPWATVSPWGVNRSYASRYDADGCLTLAETRDSLHMARVAANWARVICAKAKPHPRLISWISGLSRKNPRNRAVGLRNCRKVRAERPQIGSVSILEAKRREGVAGDLRMVARLTGAGKIEVQF